MKILIHSLLRLLLITTTAFSKAPVNQRIQAVQATVGLYEKFEAREMLSSLNISGAIVTVNSLSEGKYALQVHHTWRGEYIYKKTVSGANGSVTLAIPVFKILEGHAEYAGQDVGFVLQPVES